MSSQPSDEILNETSIKRQKLQTDPKYRHKYKVELVVFYAMLHIGAFYGLYLIVTLKPKIFTLLWVIFLKMATLQGIVLGAHRGFSHNAFKLTTFGQVLLIILETSAGQGSVFAWAREHRLHHKCVDTDADPHNSQRGFFFSHIGWLMAYKHPLVSEKGKLIDLSDLKANKLVMFQKKYIFPLSMLFCVLIPTLVPVYAWNENFWTAFFTAFLYRFVYVINVSACINSIAHMYGSKPYDARISASQVLMPDFIVFGEEAHNYHHVFPYDPEFPEVGLIGNRITTKFLHLLNRLEIAYDLKTVSPDLIYKHSKRYGDGLLVESEFDMKSN